MPTHDKTWKHWPAEHRMWAQETAVRVRQARYRWHRALRSAVHWKQSMDAEMIRLAKMTGRNEAALRKMFWRLAQCKASGRAA